MDHNLLKVTQATSRIWNPGFPMQKHILLKAEYLLSKRNEDSLPKFRGLFHNWEYIHKLYCLTVYNLTTQCPKPEIHCLKMILF